MSVNLKLAGLVTGVSVAAVVAGALVAAQQTPVLASADGQASPIGSTSKPAATPSASTPTQGSTPTATPTTPPSSKPAAVPSSGPATIKLDLTKLRQGEQPKLPWWEGRAVYGGGQEWVLGPEDGDVYDVAEVTGGVLVRSEAGLAVLGGQGSGQRVPGVTALKASADGSTSAYTIEPTGDGQYPGFRVVHRDSRTGRTTTLSRSGEKAEMLHAVTGRTIYYEATTKSSSQSKLYRWTAGQAAPQLVSTVQSPEAVSSDGTLAASVTSVNDDRVCRAMVTVATGKRHWNNCAYSVAGIRSEWGYVVAGPGYLDGYGSGMFAALDRKTGKMVHEWSGATFITWKMEDADHVLALAEHRGQTGIVRCTVSSGVCELAKPLKPGAGDVGDGRRPYEI